MPRFVSPLVLAVCLISCLVQPLSAQATPKTLVFGERMIGALTAASALNSTENVRYDVYQFTVRGERVRIKMVADEAFMNFVLTQVTPEGEREVARAASDGEQPMPRISLWLDGEYRLYARAFPGEFLHQYFVWAETPAQMRVTEYPIRLGVSISNDLTIAEAETAEGHYYIDHLIQMSAGESLTLKVDSEDFNPMLQWGTKSGAVFTQLAAPGNSGSSLSSTLTVRAATAGRYVIRVLGAGETLGWYSLSAGESAP
jgi:hypothetical protein